MTSVTFTSSFIQGDKLRKMVEQLLDWETFLGSALTLKSAAGRNLETWKNEIHLKPEDELQKVTERFECFFHTKLWILGVDGRN